MILKFGEMVEKKDKQKNQKQEIQKAVLYSWVIVRLFYFSTVQINSKNQKKTV